MIRRQVPFQTKVKLVRAYKKIVMTSGHGLHKSSRFSYSLLSFGWTIRKYNRKLMFVGALNGTPRQGGTKMLELPVVHGSGVGHGVQRLYTSSWLIQASSSSWGAHEGSPKPNLITRFNQIGTQERIPGGYQEGTRVRLASLGARRVLGTEGCQNCESPFIQCLFDHVSMSWRVPTAAIQHVL